ncbi:MAG: hypothetical protein RXR31_05915 [Thermoproteota archaeon]|jgi:hypothetical protein
MQLSKLLFALIATLIFIFALIVSLNIVSYISAQKLYSLVDIFNLAGGYYFVGLIIGIFASFLYLYWSIPRLITSDVINLTKEISNALNKIRNEMLVIQEVDKNLNDKINDNTKRIKDLEERIVALEKLVIEISSLKKK